MASFASSSVRIQINSRYCSSSPDSTRATLNNHHCGNDGHQTERDQNGDIHWSPLSTLKPDDSADDDRCADGPDLISPASGGQ